MEAVESTVEVAAAKLRIMKQQMIGEFAPGEFLAEGGRPFAAIGLGPSCRMPGLRRRNFAKGEMRREQGCAIRVGNVAAAFVGVELLIDEFFETGGRTVFARRPDLSESSLPVLEFDAEDLEVEFSAFSPNPGRDDERD